MMYFIKVRSNLSVVIVAFAVLCFTLVFPGMTPQAQAEPLVVNSLTATIDFQDPPASVLITDLSGNLLGDGEHGGLVRCFKNNCNKGTQLQLNGVEYRYKTKTAVDINLSAGTVFATGTGTISSNGQKEVFSFSAIFQNNNNGMIFVRYDASNPSASLIIPNSPGTLTILNK